MRRHRSLSDGSLGRQGKRMRLSSFLIGLGLTNDKSGGWSKPHHEPSCWSGWGNERMLFSWRYDDSSYVLISDEESNFVNGISIHGAWCLVDSDGESCSRLNTFGEREGILLTHCRTKKAAHIAALSTFERIDRSLQIAITAWHGKTTPALAL